jgi:hypothetical protein
LQKFKGPLKLKGSVKNSVEVQCLPTKRPIQPYQFQANLIWCGGPFIAVATYVHQEIFFVIFVSQALRFLFRPKGNLKYEVSCLQAFQTNSRIPEREAEAL